MKLSNNILLSIIVVVICVYVAVFDGGLLCASYTADSVRYMRMAENIKAGHLMNPDGLAGGGGWFAIWPIGYPMVLAAISAMTGLDVFWASKVVSVLCIMALLVLFWKCAKDAFPLLALSLVNLAYLKIARSTLSEPLFMVLLVTMGFAVAHLGRKANVRISWRCAALLCTLFIGLFLVRYVGFFAPVWVGAAVLICRWGWGAVGTVAVAGLGAWIFDVSYWMINKAMCGYVSGYGRVAPKESALELLRMIIGAEMHELQAYGILAFLVVGLWLAGSRLLMKKETTWPDSADKYDNGWLVFVSAGLLYHVTLVFMRCRQSFDTLGFRLLYPGTLMVVVGLVLLLSRHVSYFRAMDWSVFVNDIPLRRFAMFLLSVAIFGVWLLHGELQLRKALGIETYLLGRPYPELREVLLAKYAGVKAGTRVNIGCSCCDEDFMIAALRPDLIIDTVEK